MHVIIPEHQYLVHWDWQQVVQTYLLEQGDMKAEEIVLMKQEAPANVNNGKFVSNSFGFLVRWKW